MFVKLFEIRDVKTFIPVMAIKLSGRSEPERYLISRTGFGKTPGDQQKYVILIRLIDQKGRYDPVTWNCRTMETAHTEIIENWDNYESGAVIDVEYILGLSKFIKESERLTE